MLTDLAKFGLGLVASALLSFVSYRLGRRSVFEDRKQRAKELATAFLIELRYAELPLRNMYADPKPLDSFWYMPMPWFDKLFAEARYFAAATTQAAYDFYGQVLELNSRREVAANLREVDDAFHHDYRVKACFTLQKLRVLVKALEQEGGVRMPLTDLQHARAGILPALPPRIFPELDESRPAE